MRIVINLGKIRKFTTDTTVFIICSDAIYFLTHFEICFRRTSFDGINIYLASWTIILPNYVLWSRVVYVEERAQCDGRTRNGKVWGSIEFIVNCNEFIKLLQVYVKLFRLRMSVWSVLIVTVGYQTIHAPSHRRYFFANRLVKILQYD